MIIGNITPRVIEFPLFGRPSITFQILDTAGSPILITNDLIVELEIFRNFGDTSALVSKSSDSANLYVLDTVGTIFVPLTGIDVGVLSPQWLYCLRVKLSNVSDGAIRYVNVADLLPINNPQSWALPSYVDMALSTKFDNTLVLSGVSGGAGYLNGIATLTQPVGCVVSFTVSNVYQKWELIVWVDSTMNTATDAYQQPADFNSTTNKKVWIRRL